MCGGPVHVEISQAVCGAYSRDDFSGGAINPAIWETFVLDPGIRVEIDHGELCLRGTNAEIPEICNLKVKTDWEQWHVLMTAELG
jgi:hypothetical protein